MPSFMHFAWFSLDIFISVALAADAAALAWLGGRVSIRPLADPRSQKGHETAFVVLGLIAVALVICQGIRSREAAEIAEHHADDGINRATIAAQNAQREAGETKKETIATRNALE